MAQLSKHRERSATAVLSLMQKRLGPAGSQEGIYVSPHDGEYVREFMIDFLDADPIAQRADRLCRFLKDSPCQSCLGLVYGVMEMRLNLTMAGLDQADAMQLTRALGQFPVYLSFTPAFLRRHENDHAPISKVPVLAQMLQSSSAPVEVGYVTGVVMVRYWLSTLRSEVESPQGLRVIFEQARAKFARCRTKALNRV